MRQLFVPDGAAHASQHRHQSVCLLLSKHLAGNNRSSARARGLYLPDSVVCWRIGKKESVKTTQRLTALRCGSMAKEQ